MFEVHTSGRGGSTPLIGRIRAAAQSIPRADFRDRPPPELDRDLPVLVVRIGNYPIHHGGVAVVRSLGRAGVPVSTVVEDRLTPAALSRYARERIIWPTTGAEPMGKLVGELVAIGAGRPTRPLVICTDDEAAVVVAEHREVLEEHFILPEVPCELPRRLASKRGLRELCIEHGIPTPNSCYPTSAVELETLAEQLTFPLVMKSVDAFARLVRPASNRAMLVESMDALRAVARDWEEPYGVMLQEYLPIETSEDWMVSGYFGGAGAAAVFTGRKLHASAAYSNAMAVGVTEESDELAALAALFCSATGYRGIFDSDWRLDRRDGTMRLLDFNPRVGAQFRLFETDAGVDAVRAMHLALSGRPIPPGCVGSGDRLVVENLELAARWQRSWSPTGPCTRLDQRGQPRPRAAWLSPDDPLPALALAVRQLSWSARSRVGSARRR